MDKYVKADRVKEKCAESCKYVRVGNEEYLSVREVCKIVDEMPKDDVVEVVRCKDCKFFREVMKDCTHKFGMVKAQPNDFCNYGKRKDG